MKKVRVFLADNQQLFLEGLETVLRLKDPDVKIVGTAVSGKQTLEKLKWARPDVLLLDIAMPGMDGIETLRRIREQENTHQIGKTSPEHNNRRLKIIVFTNLEDTSLANHALSLGADEYLQKDSSVEKLLKMIRNIGGPFSQSSADDVVVDGMKQRANSSSKEGELERHAQMVSAITGSPAEASLEHGSVTWTLRNTAKELFDLSPRERQVLSFIIDGKNNTSIADALYISEKTVRNHVSHIYHTLGVKKRSEVMLWAIGQGLVR